MMGRKPGSEKEGKGKRIKHMDMSRRLADGREGVLTEHFSD